MNSGSSLQKPSESIIDDKASCINDQKYDLFKDYIQHIAHKFRLWEPNKTYRLISHLDADGIGAASIMIKLLTLLNRKYTVSILPYLDLPTLEKLKNEDYDHYIFTDLGSGHSEKIKQLFDDKFVLILDHHTPSSESMLLENYSDDVAMSCSFKCDSHVDYHAKLQELKLEANSNPKFLHVNPHLFNIDGGCELSGSGVSFLLAHKIHRGIEKVSHLAVVGSIGDVQENHGFQKLNHEILEIAKKNGLIKEINGLRLFGVQTRSLHKVLEYCTEPFIPGVSGSESGALQFLYNLGINPRTDNKFKKLIHLSENDMQKLITGLVLKSQSLDIQKLIGPVYLVKNEKKESPTRDAKEFATLLNACGRLQKASLGIGVCLNIASMKRKAIELSSRYKSEIVKNLKWVESRITKNKDLDTEEGRIIKMNNAIIINAKSSIKPTMIGTTVSIFSRSPYIKQGMFLLGMARYDDGNTKISLRSKFSNINLREFLDKVMRKLNLGETGGHFNASGAVIPSIEEQSLIDALIYEFEELNNKIQDDKSS